MRRLFLITLLFISLTAVAYGASGEWASGRPLKILIVPGHDEESSGALYRDLREAELTVALGKALFDFLSSDRVFQPFLLRDASGYHLDFQRYLIEQDGAITEFRREKRELASRLRKEGRFQKRVLVQHNRASADTVQKLFGINKWANENQFDLVIHIHFNDHPDHFPDRPGKYSGLAIYIPERQLPNHDATVPIAKAVLENLKKYFPVSDYKKERIGIVEDQELVVIGANHSLNIPALLIEYGYIYESQFVGERVRPLAFRELAYQTYRGLKEYFGDGSGKDLITLPYDWKISLKRGVNNSADVFALQLALLQKGFYPPAGFSRNYCNLTGNFGLCTELAVKNFQRKNGLKTDGHVGQKTLGVLNDLFR